MSLFNFDNVIIIRQSCKCDNLFQACQFGIGWHISSFLQVLVIICCLAHR